MHDDRTRLYFIFLLVTGFYACYMPSVTSILNVFPYVWIGFHLHWYLSFTGIYCIPGSIRLHELTHKNTNYGIWDYLSLF